jgi:hypothetical protein
VVRKIKKVKIPSRPEGLAPGMRMKGGVRFDPEIGGFVAIVHTWDNVHCRGEPEEWRSTEVFATEYAAMRYYKTSIRPALKKMMAEARQSGIKSVYRKLE